MKDGKELVMKFAAGLFFIIGILLIIAFTFTIGKNKGFAQSKFQVVVLFRNVGGLMEGAPTRLLGVNVGAVESIDFLERDVDGKRVRVTLNIFSEFRKQLENDIQFTITTEGILGEKLIEIDVIEGQAKTDLSKPIVGVDPLDVSDLAVVFTGAAESFTKTSNDLSSIDMVELAEVMRDSSKALLVTAEGINDIMDELQDIVIKSSRLINRIEEKVIEGDLFKVF